MRLFRHLLTILLASFASLSLLIVTASVVFAAPTQPALAAHAKVFKSDPGIGAIVAQAPTSVTVFTLEEMNPDPSKSNLQVYGPSTDATDTLISQGNAQVSLSDPKQMSIKITPNSGHTTGTYIVYWKTVSSDDGDAAAGTFSFTVNPAGASATATPAPQTPAQSPTANSSSSTSAAGAPIWVPIVAALVALLIGLVVGLGIGRGRGKAVGSSSRANLRSSLTAERQEEESGKHS